MLSVGCSGSGLLKGAEAQRCTAWRVAARRLASRTQRGVGPGPTRAVGWDPESVLAPPQEGHIARRQYSKKLQADASFLQQEERRLKKVQAEVTAARLARVVPDGSSPAATVEFLLDTAADDMTFEVARCRPQLDEAFFAHLKEAIRLEKFNSRSRVERVAELEGLLAVVEDGVKKLDKDTALLTAPVEKLRRLLTSTDKKAMILEMAGENAFDYAFFQLLDQNILGARDAGQEDAATFLLKVRDACMKFKSPA